MPATPSQRRNRIIVGLVAFAALCGVVGFLAGRTISSPADVAADAAPPEPSLITAPVELRRLSSSVVVRGNADLAGSVAVTVGGSFGPSTGGVAVVTGVSVQPGDVIAEGDVLVEVTQRPILALQGDLPMFRDLGPGSEGDDVEQLQDALNRIGIEVPVDGVYSEATERGVTEMYRRVGYKAPGLTEEEDSRLDAAERSLAATESFLSSSERRLKELQKPLAKSTRLQLEASLESAKSSVALAQATRTETLAAAEAASAASVVEQSTARDALAAAEACLSQIQAGSSGAELTSCPDAYTALDADTALAQATAERDQAQGLLASAEAARAAAEASEAVVVEQQDQAVASAQTQLRIQQAVYDEQIAPPDTEDAEQAVADARKDRDQAAATLAEIEAETGIRLPLAEAVFVPSLPVRVQALEVQRGDLVEGPVMYVSGTEVTITSAVTASDRSFVREDMIATVDDAALEIEFEAEITEIADTPGGQASDGRYYMELSPLGDLDDIAGPGDFGADIPGFGIAGLNLRVTIPIESTGGEVLTVPLAALAAGGDGSVRVEVESDTTPGETRTVTVTTGLETTGFVEISAVDGAISAGDRVVVGRQ